MKKLLVIALSIALLAVVTGCTAPLGNIYAPVQVTKSALAVGPASSWSKVGEAKTEAIILVGFGDSSIDAAMKAGGITDIHHVDSEELCVLGIYSRFTTKVYGN